MASTLNVVSLTDKLSARVLQGSLETLVKSVNHCKRTAVRRTHAVRIQYAGRTQTVMSVPASPDAWVIPNRVVCAKLSRPTNVTTSAAERMPFAG